MLESVPGTNQYLAMRLKFLAQGNDGNLCWGLNSQLTGDHDYESDALPTAPRRPWSSVFHATQEP